jgi:hypothetical protein
MSESIPERAARMKDEMHSTQYKHALSRMRNAEAESAVMREALEIVEWNGVAPTPQGGRCPACTEIRPHHRPACAVCAALSGTAGRVLLERIEALRCALDAYKSDPVNAYDKPSSWAKLDALIRAAEEVAKEMDR